MFSNIAYEAFYQYLGLGLQERVVEAITSEAFFRGLVLLIFGVMLVWTLAKFSSRYISGSLIHRKSVPISKFFYVFFYLILGLSLLKVDLSTSVHDFDRKSWHVNPYIKGKIEAPKKSYKVSLPFDLMTRSAEELGAALSRIVDGLFKVDHSQLEAPNLFYKAIIHSASTTIDDPKLRGIVDFYNSQCLEKIFHIVGTKPKGDLVGRAYRSTTQVDNALSEIKFKTDEGEESDCLEVKEEVRSGLIALAEKKARPIVVPIEEHFKKNSAFEEETLTNFYASNMLVNHYMEDKETYAGLMKGAQPVGFAGRVIQYLSRTMSWDGFINLVSFGEGKEIFGAASAAKKATEFSENLARAPHLAGMIKMVLIIIFPFLIFFVVAGKWKVLVWWWAIYFSVVLWNPLWTLFYHIMVSISKSTSVMAQFGELNDAISLYGASLIQSRIYYMHTIYSWIQVLVGVGLTGGTMFFLRPMLGANSPETTPEFIDDTSKAAGVATKAVGVIT